MRKIINTRTLEGLKKAEWYKSRGYTVNICGWDSVVVTGGKK